MHILADRVKSLRIAGNIIGFAVAVIVLLGIAKRYTPYILGIVAVIVATLKAISAFGEGFKIPMLILIGVSLFLLIRLLQVKAMESISTTSTGGNVGARRLRHRRWVAHLAALFGTAVVLFSGLPVNTNIKRQTFDGRLKGADYWGAEPLILSAGMGFDNIIGVPKLTKEDVRDVGGSWYRSVSCTNGEELDDGIKTGVTLASTIDAIA